MNYELLSALLIVHWIADFTLQSDKMATRKSSCWGWLLFHCLIYSACFSMFGSLRLVVWLLLTHFLIDFITSRITKYLWAKKDVHNFFVVIGFDQLLHYICILVWFKYYA